MNNYGIPVIYKIVSSKTYRISVSMSSLVPLLPAISKLNVLYSSLSVLTAF